MTLWGTRRALTGRPRRAAVSYRLREDFPADASAPLTSPRPCEPGPGTLTITDTGGKLSISGGSLTASGSAVGANDPRVISDSQPRARGRALMATLTSDGGFSAFAWDTNTDLAAGFDHGFYVPTSGQKLERAGVVLMDTFTNGMRLAVVLQDPGAYYFAGNKLVHVDAGSSSSPLYGGLAARVALAFPTTASLYIRDLGGAFATADGIALLTVSAPASGAAQTAAADAIHHFSFTLPGAPSAGDKIELRYRVADASNTWTAYLERNAGNTAWDFKLDSVSAGIATNRISVAGVGTPNALAVTVEGTLHDVYTVSNYGSASEAWTKRGSQINVSHQNSQTAVNATYAAGTTASALKSFARTSSHYSVLDVM